MMMDSQTNILVDITLPVEPWRYHATALADFAPARSLLFHYAFHYAPARLGVVFHFSLITVCKMKMVGLLMKKIVYVIYVRGTVIGYLELAFTLATAQNLLKWGLRRE